MSASHPLVEAIQAKTLGANKASVTTPGAMPFQYLESKTDTALAVPVCNLVVRDLTAVTQLHFTLKTVFGNATLDGANYTTNNITPNNGVVNLPANKRISIRHHPGAFQAR